MSEHFTIGELTHTNTGLPNIPNADALGNLDALCERILEVWRAKVGPIKIHSGYRSRAVNTAVGGDPNSQHMLGEAADCTPINLALWPAFKLLWSLTPWLPVGQAIIYPHDGFIHVSIDIDRDPRLEFWECVDPKRRLPLKRYNPVG